MYTKLAHADAMGIRFADGGEEQTGAAPQQSTTVTQTPPVTAPEVVGPFREQPRQDPLPNGEHGYPENTPLEHMTDAQRAAYWKHKARKHENQWKAVVDKNLTPDQVLQMQQQLDEANRERMDAHQREVEDAKRDAAREARANLIPELVQARIEAAVARRNPEMSDDDIRSRLEFVDLSKFLTSKGEVDPDKVSNYAATLTPASTPDGSKKKFPDMGGGTRGPLNVSAKERAKQNARERGYIRDAK